LIDRNSDQLTSVQTVPAYATAMAAIEAAAIEGANNDNDINHNTFTAFSLWQPLVHTVAVVNQYDEIQAVRVACDCDGSYQLEIDGEQHSLEYNHDGKLTFDHKTVSARAVTHAAGVSVFADRAWHYTVPDPLEGSADAIGGDNIVAPMPGQIKVVNKIAGDTVEAGEALLVLEAMKMEHTLTAPRDGIIAEVMASVGDQVEGGAVLLGLQEESTS